MFSEREQARIHEAASLEAALIAYAAGQDVGPVDVTVDPTWYDPALGGINGNGDPMTLGPSAYQTQAKDHYYDAAACPPELPYKSTLAFTSHHGEHIQVRCLDGGGSIVIRDGVIRLDLLRKEPVWRQDYPATLYLPGTPIPPRPKPEYVKAPGTCPVWSCDPYLVKIQGVMGGSLPGEAHWGVDLHTGTGGEVRAPWAAEVLFVGEHPGLGGYVELDYGDGYTSKLGHLDPMVAGGWMVTAGQLIGYVDDSGITRDSAHVHFELWKDGAALDVLEVLLSEEQPDAG